MGLRGKPAPGAEGVMLEGPRRLAMMLLSDSVLQWLLSGLGFLFLLLLLYILLRRQRLAMAVLWALAATVEGLAFVVPSPLILWVVPPLIATLHLIAVARFGLLTTIAFQFFFNLSFHYVVTTNWSSWYAQGMYITLGLAVAVAVYSFYVALAGQPLFRSAVLQE